MIDTVFAVKHLPLSGRVSARVAARSRPRQAPAEPAAVVLRAPSLGSRAVLTRAAVDWRPAPLRLPVALPARAQACDTAPASSPSPMPDATTCEQLRTGRPSSASPPHASADRTLEGSDCIWLPPGSPCTAPFAAGRFHRGQSGLGRVGLCRIVAPVVPGQQRPSAVRVFEQS